MCNNEYFQADSNVDMGKNIGGNFHFYLSDHFMPPLGHFLGPFLLYRAQKKISSKNSEKNLKNVEKYSKNNGENRSSNRWTVKKLWPKNCLKRTIFKNGPI